MRYQDKRQHNKNSESRIEWNITPNDKWESRYTIIGTYNGTQIQFNDVLWNEVDIVKKSIKHQLMAI